MSKEEILRHAQIEGLKVAFQYAHYSPETWTVAVKLNDYRVNAVLTDESIVKFRIEYEN